MIRRVPLRSVLLGLTAPVAALAFAVIVTTLILVATGHAPGDVYNALVQQAQKPRTFVNSVNSATTYYLSALAVAIGFRMNLFNIGVDGQYRLAALVSAAFAGATFMDGVPAVVRVAATIVVAVLVGALWAGLAGFLKVTRGVSEVISTIMLNSVATFLGSFLLTKWAVSVAGSNNIGTRPITAGGQVPGFSYGGVPDQTIFGLILLAVAAGAGYAFLLRRTRFGFDLRATGLSQSAAVAAGVNVRRMVLYTMLLSGAVAGLVGMPQLLGASYSYSLDFPTGIGFTGIAIALLGRNTPVGMAAAALLWGFLDQTANVLDFQNVPKELVLIIQGVIVLSVVIAYELVRRYRLVLQQRDVGRSTGAVPPAAPPSAPEPAGVGG